MLKPNAFSRVRFKRRFILICTLSDFPDCYLYAHLRVLRSFSISALASHPRLIGFHVCFVAPYSPFLLASLSPFFLKP